MHAFHLRLFTEKKFKNSNNFEKLSNLNYMYMYFNS